MENLKNNEFKEMLISGVIFSPLALAKEKKEIDNGIRASSDLELYDKVKKEGYEVGMDIEVSVQHETKLVGGKLYYVCYLEARLLKYAKRCPWVNQAPKVLIHRTFNTSCVVMNFEKIFNSWNETLRLRFIDGVAWSLELFLRDALKIISENKSKKELAKQKRQTRKIAKIMQELNKGL